MESRIDRLNVTIDLDAPNHKRRGHPILQRGGVERRAVAKDKHFILLKVHAVNSLWAKIYAVELVRTFGLDPVKPGITEKRQIRDRKCYVPLFCSRVGNRNPRA